MTKVIATKRYFPDSRSMAGWDTSNPDRIADWWRWGEKFQTNAMSMAEDILIRQRLKKGDFELDAVKQPGHILVRAY